MKALIVCLSSDLPIFSHRDSNCIYFVYNTLDMYIGQAPYSDNYSIVENYPSDPIPDHLYIDLSDGYCKVFAGEETNIIAKVQTDAMLEVIRQAGTMHFYNTKEQYVDTTTRMLSIPFSDGEYSLTVDVPNDLLYNRNTIIKYNEDTGKFEIYGETNDEDPLDTKGWRGHNSDTVNLAVGDGTIRADVNISDRNDNIIQILEDGLYAYQHNTLTREEFESWKSSYQNYTETLDYFITILSNKIESVEDIINPDILDNKIHNILLSMYPSIDQAIADYEELKTKLDNLFDFAEQYADERFAAAVEYLDNLVNEALEHPWVDLGEQEDEG